jgi:amino-acid N-acetyltransferase
MKHFFYAGSSDRPQGLVGIEIHGADALLRSLVVAPGMRATGLGTALVRRAESHARAQGVRGMYLLTTTAELFFARRGYARRGRAEAPAGIRATREFADICPASSIFMFKSL